jgi:hypothetical protein
MTVVKLASSRDRPAVKACSTCAHVQGRHAVFQQCKALGTYCSSARISDCENGEFWEPQPKKIGLVGHIKRLIFGEQ